MSLPGEKGIFGAGMRWRLGLLAVSSLAAIGLGFAWADGAGAGLAMKRWGYPILAGTTLAFVWTLVCCLREDRPAWPLFSAAECRERVRQRWRAWRKAPWQEFRGSIAVMAIGGTMVCALAEPMGFKILFDEYVLQTTAQYMHLTREVGTMVRAHEVEGVWLPLGTYVDKRPVFFAFLLSLVHDFSGFRAANAFVLNHALTGLLLVFVAFVVRRLTGSREAGVLAGWALAFLPLLGQNANGSGMEVLNAVMIVAVLLLGLRLLERPGAARQDAFLLGAILLAQCRYESALYVPAAGLIVLAAWWNSRAPEVTPLTILAPLALLPVAWVRQVFAANEVLWQLPEHLERPFGARHVAENLREAGRYLFSTGVSYSSLAPLAFVGIAALGFLGVAWWRRSRSTSAFQPGQAAALWLLVVLGNFVLLMHYYWGQLTDPLVSRLSLPLWILLACVFAMVVAHYDGRRRRIIGPALVITLVLGAAWQGRATAQHVYTQENILEQEIRWELDWVAARPAGPRIVITNKSSLPWLLERVPAVLTQSARGRIDALGFQLEHGARLEILVTQRLRPTSAAGEFEVDLEDVLPPEVKLERLAQRRFGYSIATINRVVAVEPPPPSPALDEP